MQNARILIVDDDAILAARLEETLLQLGYQPTGMAATGNAAVEMALTQKPDAILMDIRLRGEMTGIQAAEAIHRSADIPIIYLTAYTEENLVRQASITDAYAYLAKPVRDRELRASLEMALFKHATEKRLQHLNQVLRAVRDINQLITRKQDAQRLLDETCKILVQTRGYRLVWIGKTTPEDRLVHPVACAGEETGYLDQVEISWDESQTGQGPTGIAIREMKPVICHDLAEDPGYTPWREAAMKHGFLSMAAIPIMHEQRLMNILCVYGDLRDLFGDEEVDLLDEVAHDLAFAFVALEEETARKRAEAEIQRLASFPQLNPNPVLEVNEKGAITFMNQAACSLLETEGQRADPSMLLPQEIGSILKQLMQGEPALIYREVAVGKRVLGEDLHLLPQFGVVRIYARDITERRQAEQERIESEQKFRNVFDHSAVGKSITSLDGTVNVNQAFCNMLGYTLAELSQIKWLEITHPDDIEFSQEQLRTLKAGEKDSARFIKRYIRKDGSVVWVDAHTVLQRDRGGKPQYYITELVDITEQEIAEEKLRKQHEQLIKFSSQVPGMLYQFMQRPDGTYCVPYASEAIRDIFGCSPGEVKEDFSPISRVILPEDLAVVLQSIEDSARNLTPWQCEYRVQIPGRVVRWIWAQSMPERQPDESIIWYGFNADISEQKLAQAALLESDKRFHELFDQMLAAFALHEIICDGNNRPVDYRFLELNQAFESLTGLKRDEIIGRTVLEVFPQIEPSWIERYGKVAITGEPCHFEQFFAPLGKNFEISAFSPRPGQFAVTFTDVTASIQAVEGKRQAEESYRAVFDNAPVGIFQSTPEGGYRKINQALADIYGYDSTEEMISKVTDITNQLYADPSERLDFLRDMEKYGEVHNDQVRNRRKDGSLIWISRSARSVTNSKGEILYYEGFLQDITERKLSEQLLKARLEIREYALSHSSEEIIRKTLDLVEQTTHSSLSFLQPIDLKQTAITNQIWSSKSIAIMSMAKGDGIHPPDGQDCGWLECISQRRPVIHNNYANPADSITLPEGHPQILRELLVPIIHEDKVVAILGVGNKPFDYNDTDIHTISDLSILAWDVLSNMRAEEALQTSEQQYRTTLDSMGEAIHLVDNNLRIILINQAFKNWVSSFGLNTDVVGLNLFSAFPFLADTVREEYHQVFQTGEMLITEDTNSFGERLVTTVTRKIPILEDGNVVRIVTVLEDITEQKTAEQALCESEERFRNIFEGVQDAIFVESPTGKILDVNLRACEMFGYSRAEFLTKHVTDLVPQGSLAVVIDDNSSDILSGQPVETLNRRADGESFPVELSCRSQEINGKPALLVVLRDITNRKRAEEALRAALRDKEVLLRELYHRTKNNMQVISALLNMEADRSGDAALQKTLRDMDTRILAMALVHEKLYQSKNLAYIDLKDYIANLAALILESYDVRTEQVRLSITADSVTIPIESAIPCGLLVNEIISNSLKHAFPSGRTGEIKICLTQLERGAVILDISDNGIGVPPEIDLHNLKSLGMRIIFGIASHQLHAQVQVQTSNGVGWCIQFPDLTDQKGNETIHLQ